MKKSIISGLAALAMMAPVSSVLARDLGPQKAVTRLTTNTTVGTSVAIPIGETGRFSPEFMIIKGRPATTTNAISYVVQGVTNAFSAATTDAVIALTNIPPMFAGDRFIVKPSAMATNDVVDVTVIGSVFD